MEYPVNYDSPIELRAFLESGQLSMKKRFGQNFLVNRGAREKIISCLPIKDGDSVWEIGPGLGAMTWHLLDMNAEVTVFEIDHGFISSLKDFYGDLSNFKMIEGDFLKNFKLINKDDSPAFILGNLPYVSGSVMIAEIIRSAIKPQRMVFTLQKEVGRRMAASPRREGLFQFLPRLSVKIRYIPARRSEARFILPENRLFNRPSSSLGPMGDFLREGLISIISSSMISFLQGERRSLTICQAGV